MSQVDAYFANLPDGSRAVMEQVRAVTREVAPELQETIKYDMPTLVGNGNVLGYAAWKNHFSFYPVPRGDADLAEAMAPYVTGKGTVSFTYDDPPLDLIRRIVKHQAALDRQRPPSKRKE